MATDSNERASERVLSELDGEIEMAKATCFTHSVTIAENVRPVFTQVLLVYHIQQPFNNTVYYFKNKIILC